MYKIKEFLYKFFTPKGMKNYRYMTILASILMFLFEVYALFFPVNQILNTKPEKYISSNDYTKVFYNIEGSIDNAMYVSSYKIVDGKMTSNDENEGLKIYKYAYDEIDVYYIFDVNYSVSEAVKEIKDKYKERYPSEDNLKIEYSGLLIYVEIQKGTSLEDAIDKYQKLDIDSINECLNQLSFKDTYNLNSDSAYVMLFEGTRFYIEVPDENSVFSDYASYRNINFDINNYESLNDFSKIFVTEIGRTYAKNAGIVYLSNCIIYALVFPFILALIVWLGLKKRSDLKRFKEYYNILAISSTVPCLISFILGWFISSTSGLVYLSLMAIYGLVVLYKASTPFTNNY